jgi:hypothetical protein
MGDGKIVIAAQELFLEQLDTLLCENYLAYQQYLSFGKSLKSAIVIKANNNSIADLISENLEFFQGEQKKDLQSIINHIDSWREQWDSIYDNGLFGPDDEFTFETRVKFPRNALIRLSAYYSNHFNKKFVQLL